MTKQTIQRYLLASLPLFLAACVTTGSVSERADVQSNAMATQAPDSPETDFFTVNGFHADDVLKVAVLMAGDIPQTPQLAVQGGGVNTIVVNARDVRLLDERVTLNRSAFAQSLQAELERFSDKHVRYVAERRISAVSSRTSTSQMGGSSRGGSSSRSGGGSRTARDAGEGGSGRANTYHLQVSVSTLPAQDPQQGAQRYALELVESAARKVVWQGAYDLDAPPTP